jgi:DNA-binding HxlR family transcriptional regulator
VGRSVRAGRPVRVDYFLTKPGKGLIPMMQELCDWGSEQFGIVGTLKQPGGKMRREP